MWSGSEWVDGLLMASPLFDTHTVHSSCSNTRPSNPDVAVNGPLMKGCYKSLCPACVKPVV